MRIRKAVYRILYAARQRQGWLGAAQLRAIPFGLFLASIGCPLRPAFAPVVQLIMELASCE